MPLPSHRSWLAPLLLLLMLAAPARAQERPTEDDEEAGSGQTETDKEGLYDELVAQFQRDYLRFTALIQVVPQLILEDTEAVQSGFSIAAARFGIAGLLDGGFGYRIQAEFARSPALLDAYVSYRPNEATRILVGRHKVPFSYEFLTSAAGIDFVNRSRVVRALAPGRGVGGSMRTQVAGEALTLRAGLFNASFNTTVDGRTVRQAQRGGFTFVGRAQSTTQPSSGTTLIVGANVAYDTPDTAKALDVPGRLLLGADVRLRAGPFLLAAEGIAERVGDDVFPDSDGFYLTGGVDLNANNRLLVRFDRFEGSDEVLLGYNLTLTRAAAFQANVVLPLDDAAEPTQALLNVQLGF
ncbi:MAG: porin [Rhodothermales bacterium]